MSERLILIGMIEDICPDPCRVRAAGHEPMRLGLTKEGAPRHPLYIKNNAPLAALRAGTDREGER